MALPRTLLTMIRRDTAPNTAEPPANGGLAALRARFAQRLPDRVDELLGAHRFATTAVVATVASPASATAARWHELQRLAHRFGGTAGSYGFAELSRLALSISERLRQLPPGQHLDNATTAHINELMARLVNAAAPFRDSANEPG